MSIFYYLIEANAYLLVFYAFYRIVLKNETFYTINRFYLLATSFISFLLPAIQLSGLNGQDVQYVTYTSTESVQQVIFWTPFHILLTVYLLAAAFFLGRLGLRLYRILFLIKQSKIKNENGFRRVEILDQELPFSFMNYMFVNPNLPKIETIIRHEQVHIRQWHSADILFFELLRIVNWFNPLISRIQADIKTLHEYIADEKTAAMENCASDYALFLIHHSYGVENACLNNQMFNRTLLKKRIEMLNRKRSGQKALLKYALLLILLPFMLCVSALAFTKDYAVLDLMPKSSNKVSASIASISVIDHTISQQPTPNKKLAPPPPPPPPPAEPKAGFYIWNTKSKRYVRIENVELTSAQKQELKEYLAGPPPPPPPPSAIKKGSSSSKQIKPPPPPPPPAVKKVNTGASAVKKFPPPVVVDKEGATVTKAFPPPIVVVEKKKPTAIKAFPPPIVVDKEKTTTVKRFPPPVIIDKEEKAAPSKSMPPPPPPPAEKINNGGKVWSMPVPSKTMTKVANPTEINTKDQVKSYGSMSKPDEIKITYDKKGMALIN